MQMTCDGLPQFTKLGQINCNSRLVKSNESRTSKTKEVVSKVYNSKTVLTICNFRPLPVYRQAGQPPQRGGIIPLWGIYRGSVTEKLTN